MRTYVKFFWYYLLSKTKNRKTIAWNDCPVIFVQNQWKSNVASPAHSWRNFISRYDKTRTRFQINIAIISRVLCIYIYMGIFSRYLANLHSKKDENCSNDQLYCRLLHEHICSCGEGKGKRNYSPSPPRLNAWHPCSSESLITL